MQQALDQHIEWLKGMGLSEERTISLANNIYDPFNPFKFPTSSRGEEKLQQLKTKDGTSINHVRIIQRSCFSVI